MFVADQHNLPSREDIERIQRPSGRLSMDGLRGAPSVARQVSDRADPLRAYDEISLAAKLAQVDASHLNSTFSFRARRAPALVLVVLSIAIVAVIFFKTDDSISISGDVLAINANLSSTLLAPKLIARRTPRIEEIHRLNSSNVQSSSFDAPSISEISVFAHVVRCKANLLVCSDINTEMERFADQEDCNAHLPKLIEAVRASSAPTDVVLGRCRFPLARTSVHLGLRGENLPAN
jgi:hypothetical protein